jgi:membrane protein YqaA with SNARE-associated domain
MDLAFLFISALAASTILPMSSEVVLGALAVSGAADVWLLLAVATAGNTLGAVVNWGIGRYASTWRTRLHWLEEAKFERACRWFNRWGIWCLLLSWLPVVGDPLTVVAGVLRSIRPLCATRARWQSSSISVRPAHRDLRVAGLRPVRRHRGTACPV